MSIADFIRELARWLRTQYHAIRAQIYWRALAHHGHTGPDGAEITRRALASQLHVDRFVGQ